MFSHRIHKTIIQINVCVCVLKVTCVIIMLYKKNHYHLERNREGEGKAATLQRRLCKADNTWTEMSRNQ